MQRTRGVLTLVAWLAAAAIGVTVALTWRQPAGRIDTIIVEPEASAASASEAPIQIASFALTDQDDHPLSDGSLRGKPWIGAFIFTRCAGPCPLMTRNMVDLQKRLGDANVDLVSFSVDPEYDTPQVLRSYAQRFGADTARWHFVTGTRQAIYNIASALKLGVQAAQDAMPIMHSTKLVLVTPTGQVQAYYDSTNRKDIDRIVADALALAASVRTP